MDEVWRGTHGGREADAKLRVARLAARQAGVVARRQLLLLGAYDELIRRWVHSAYLIRRLPGIYAVGHVAPSRLADLTAALLYAGPGAMLSHATGAWWLGLLDHQPRAIHVSTARRLASKGRICVHGRRTLTRIWHHGLPIAPPGQILMDLAVTGSQRDLRHALANAEYHGYLKLDAVESLIGQGRRGTAAMRHALKRHQPQLARTRTELERALLAVCEQHNLPIPEFNVRVEGFLVDALWRERRVVVEVDGRAGHSTWARIRNDRRRDLVLRRALYVPLRYVWEQVTEQSADVAQDIRAALAPG